MTDITPPAPSGSGLDLRARLRLIQVRTQSLDGFILIALSGTGHRLHGLAVEAGHIRAVASVPVDNVGNATELVEESVLRMGQPPVGALASMRTVRNPLGWFSPHGTPLAGIVGNALPDGLAPEAVAEILGSYGTLVARELARVRSMASPLEVEAAEAMSDAAEFNWRAARMVASGDPAGTALRGFAQANPGLAGVVPIADCVMLGEKLHGKGPVTKAVLAGARPSDVARIMAPAGKLCLAAGRSLFDVRAFDRLEGVPLFGTNADRLDVIACAGTMPPSWVPRDADAMRAFTEVLGCLRAGLGKRIHPASAERADVLFAGARGDWRAVLGKAISAAGLPPDSGAPELRGLLGDWRRARSEFVDDVLVPATLLQGCPVIVETARLDPVYREERLDTLADNMLTRGMPLPALAAQAARYRAHAKAIAAARAGFALSKGGAPGDGISHRLRYDAHALGGLEAVLSAWRPVLPRSLRKMDVQAMLEAERSLWEASLLGRKAALEGRVGMPKAACPPKRRRPIMTLIGRSDMISSHADEDAGGAP